MKKITIAVVDDHKLIRQMWYKLFEDNGDIEVVGESGEFNDAIQMIKLMRPDIVLLDINLSQSSGMDAVPMIRKFCPATRIIAVSMHNQPAYAKKMLQLGAKSYITKNSSHEEIFKAIEEVMNGRIYVCSEIKEILSELVMNHESDRPDLRNLSVREMQIVQLLKEGHSSKEIGIELSISLRTVEVHRRNILKKLKLKNTSALINFINTNTINF